MENGLWPSDQEDIVSTHGIPKEICLDDERALVLNPS
jgi:hypothetical protein